MRLLTAVAVPLLVPLGLIPSTLPSYADADSCRGLPATLVSTSPTVTGTDGNDVIVAHGASTVAGRGGDDTICLLDSLPSTAGGPGVRVETGAGADVVDASADTSAGVRVLQAETVVGGPGPDLVVLVDGLPPAVSTGGGDDEVEMGGYLSRGVVDLGAGDDEFVETSGDTSEVILPLRLAMRVPMLTVGGGEGDDTFSVDAGQGRWRLDLRSETWTGPTTEEIAFSGFDDYAVGTSGHPDTRVDVTGTSGPDDVLVDGTALGEVHLGRGADTVRVPGAGSVPRARSAIDGGKGDDTLVAMFWGPDQPSAAHIDLAAGTVSSGRSRPVHLRGIEDVVAAATGTLTLAGDRHGNRLEWLGCRGGSVRGGAGDDEIVYVTEIGGPQSPAPVELSCERAPRMHGYGGTGDDLLAGGPEADLLAGDRGRDRARGGAGDDRCPAVERRSSC